MVYELTEAHLASMFALANFDVPDNEMIFFGLRGTQPLDQSGKMAMAHKVVDKDVDFSHMRCSLGQWLPGQGFALFPASTVPNGNSVAKKVANNGNGVNMMATCYLTSHSPTATGHRYKKGDHGLTSSLGPHRAFRNESRLPLWRTGDDTDFEGDDRFLFEQAFDNLHCSHHMDPSVPGYSSFGCQVVAGRRGGPTSAPGGEKGPWKVFVDRAYSIDQSFFRYALFNTGEAMRTVHLGADQRGQTIRFGSTGPLAVALQQALIAAGHNIGAAGADGQIGFQTIGAVRDIQFQAFGKSGVDLVVGAQTAAEIGMTWPGSESSGLGESGHDDLHDLHTDLHGFHDDPVPVLPDPVAPIGGPAFSVTPRSELTSKGKTRWVFDDPTDGSKRYLGGEAELQGFKGLARTFGFNDEKAPRYSHKNWIDTHGVWAGLIEPTGQGESRNSFSCLNSYDRAAFTFGFYQLAAHTPNDNLILMFRALLKSPEAAHYFPDLELKDGKVHQRTATGLKSLEGAQNRPDGANRPKEQGAFMHYLNADMDRVDAPELRGAAALIHWACHSEAHQAIQVDLAVELAKKKVKHTANKVASRGASLNGASMPVTALVLDIVHNGRGGRTTFDKIAAALNASNQMSALKKIGRTATFADRIDTVASKAESLFSKAPFKGLTYRKSTNSFS